MEHRTHSPPLAFSGMKIIFWFSIGWPGSVQRTDFILATLSRRVFSTGYYVGYGIAGRAAETELSGMKICAVELGHHGLSVASSVSMMLAAPEPYLLGHSQEAAPPATSPENTLCPPGLAPAK